MKKHLVLFFAVTFSITSALGQGTVNFANVGGTTRITNGLTNQRLAVGNAFHVGLYAAPDGVTDEAALVQVGAPTGIGPVAGGFTGGARTIQGIPPGGFAMVQIRVWESAYGTSYESVVTAPPMNGRRGLLGKSNLLRVDTADTSTVPPEILANLYQASPITLLPATGGPFVYANSVIVAEGTNGAVTANFTVALGVPDGALVSVDYATADGTALAGQDYVATSGTLTFNPGETTKTVAVIVTGDTSPEPDEEFYLQLSNPVNTLISDPPGRCLITEVMVTGIRVDARISFNTVIGHRYTLEKSDDFVTWTPVIGGQELTATGEMMTVTDEGGGCQPSRMYRARLLE